MTHFYFGINYKVVWAVVKKELPVIEPVITKVMIDVGIKHNITDVTLIEDAKRLKGKPIASKTNFQKPKRTANK